MKKILLLGFALFLFGCENVGSVDHIANRLNTERDKAASIFPEEKVVRIVKYFDFGCSHCGKAAEVFKNLKEEFGSDIDIEYKHLTINDDFVSVAEASECARDQGQFKPFYYKYFENYFGEKTNETLEEIALEVEVDLEEFRTCLDSGIMKERIALHSKEALKQGAQGTPFFVFNESMTVPGMLPESSFRNLIEELLNPAVEEEAVEGETEENLEDDMNVLE